MTDFQALHLATPATSFTALQRQHIENLAEDLTKTLGTAVEAYFGDTATGDQWADLSVSELPLGAWVQPGPLLTIEAGSGQYGGHRVISRAMQVVGAASGTLDYEQLTRHVRKEARAAYRAMCQGAVAVH